jgi:hypothetical protein
MSIAQLLALIFIVIFISRFVKRLKEDDQKLAQHGRRAIEELSASMRPDARTPPGFRVPGRVLPQPATVTRPGTRDTPARPARRAASRGVRNTGASLDDWYLVLDVSPAATRREIQDAVKLRLSRARAERDSEAIRRVLRAASTALGQAHRSRKQ